MGGDAGCGSANGNHDPGGLIDDVMHARQALTLLTRVSMNSQPSRVEDGGDGGGAEDTQDQRPRRGAPGGEDGHTAIVTPPSTVQARCCGVAPRRVRGMRRCGCRPGPPRSAARGRTPDTGQARSGDEIAAAGQGNAAGHNPPVGSSLSGHHADGLAHRAVRGWLERARDQVAAGEHDRRQAGRNNRPPAAHGAGRTGQAAGTAAGRCQWAVLITGHPARAGNPASAHQAMRTRPVTRALSWLGGRRQRVHAGQALAGDTHRGQRDDRRQQADRRADQGAL